MSPLVVGVSIDVLDLMSSIWCDRCGLPSAVRVSSIILFDDKPDCVITVEACIECGQERFV